MHHGDDEAAEHEEEIDAGVPCPEDAANRCPQHSLGMRQHDRRRGDASRGLDGGELMCGGECFHAGRLHR